MVGQLGYLVLIALGVRYGGSPKYTMSVPRGAFVGVLAIRVVRRVAVVFSFQG